MDDLDFSEAEICQELERLGYTNLPFQRIKEFKKDLERLIQQDRSSTTLSTSNASNSFYPGDGLPNASSRVHLQDQSNLFVHKGSNISGYLPKASANNRINISKSHSYSDKLCQERQSVATNYAAKQVSSTEVQLKSCLKNSELPNYSRVDNPSGNQVNHTSGDTSSSTLAESSARDLSTDASLDDTHLSDRRKIKRKVLRKVGGRVEVNESVTEDDSSVDGQNNYLPSRTILTSNRPFSAPPVIPESHGHFGCREPSAYSLPDGYEGPKSLIRPMSCDPHSKNIKKSDPVTRYQQYRQCWDVCQAPGEKSHKQLRWDVREQMLFHDQVIIKKPQPVHPPNSYIIPSDKKRKALRWQIRADLANGVKPPSMFD